MFEANLKGSSVRTIIIEPFLLRVNNTSNLIHSINIHNLWTENMYQQVNFSKFKPGKLTHFSQKQNFTNARLYVLNENCVTYVELISLHNNWDDNRTLQQNILLLLVLSIHVQLLWINPFQVQV